MFETTCVIREGWSTCIWPEQTSQQTTPTSLCQLHVQSTRPCQHTIDSSTLTKPTPHFQPNSVHPGDHWREIDFIGCGNRGTKATATTAAKWGEPGYIGHLLHLSICLHRFNDMPIAWSCHWSTIGEEIDLWSMMSRKDNSRVRGTATRKPSVLGVV